MRQPTDREQIDYLSAEVARLREIIRNLTRQDQEPVAGLTRNQSRLIRALEGAGGRMLTHDALMDAVYWDGLRDAPQPFTLKVMVWHIRRRRPDIAARLRLHRGQGYALLPEGTS